VTYLPDSRNSLSGTLSAQYSVASGRAAQAGVGDSSWIFSGGAGFGHAISPHTLTAVAAGAALSRTPLGGGYTEYSIYPTFNASITNNALSLGRGRLAFGASISSAPTIDLVTGAVDPRLGVGGQMGWGLDRFSANLSANSTFSLTSPHSPAAYRSVGGASGIAYRFGSALSADTGVRVAWQTFEAQPIIPLSYAVYVGVTIGAAVPLNH
jgi:hypothetical protein